MLTLVPPTRGYRRLMHLLDVGIPETAANLSHSCPDGDTLLDLLSVQGKVSIVDPRVNLLKLFEIQGPRDPSGQVEDSLELLADPVPPFRYQAVIISIF